MFYANLATGPPDDNEESLLTSPDSDKAMNITQAPQSLIDAMKLTKHPGLLCLILLAYTAQLGRPLRLAVIEQREEFPEGYHDLRQVAQALHNRNNMVDILHAAEHFPEWQEYLTMEDEITPRYDAVIASAATCPEGICCPACLQELFSHLSSHPLRTTYLIFSIM